MLFHSFAGVAVALVLNAEDEWMECLPSENSGNPNIEGLYCESWCGRQSYFDPLTVGSMFNLYLNPTD